MPETLLLNEKLLEDASSVLKIKRDEVTYVRKTL